MKLNPLFAFLAAVLALFPFSARAVLVFDWPDGAGVAQKIQALKQEISNIKTLVANSKSKTPISAQAYLAVDLSSGKALLQKKPDAVHSMASVTKLMSAVVALENLDTAQVVTLTKKMLAPEGSSATLFAGANISVQNLLRASLIQSANDAIESLAQSAGKEKFISLMNAKAEELGMDKTVYADVCGLDQKSRSNADDLAKLLAYINKTHPEIWAITKDNNFWLPDSKGELLKFQNMNNFQYLPQFVGGKTGYLPQAKASFAAIFEIDKKPVAIVLLHSNNYQADTFKIIKQLEKQI
jgi:D-alanyl-D-alanine carboxypeptidase